MKKALKVVRNVLIVICILVTLCLLCICLNPYKKIEIVKSDYGYYKENIEKLRSCGSYSVDTATFTMRIIQDSVRAKEIRDYFKLDTLYSSEDDTWRKTLAIAKFVATNIPHDNQKEWPKRVNAIGLWEYTKNVAPAFNCRLHSILTFELLLSSGIKARYVTCMPESSSDNDCHVVNEVWLPEIGKWAMIDSDGGGRYVTDIEEVPLSLAEMRENYISGKKMIVNEEFCKKTSSGHNWYYQYMAKNTYWFSCWGTLSYYQEDYKNDSVIRDSYVNLIPQGFEPFRIGGGNTITTNADKFWTLEE